MSDSNPDSAKSRGHSYKEGHFLSQHGVVKGSAGAGRALLLELSDDSEILKGQIEFFLDSLVIMQSGS